MSREPSRSSPVEKVEGEEKAPSRARLVGKLGGHEDMGLADLLQLLSLNKKTGKLTLTRRDGQGVIVLRGGRIIYSASDSIRETLGNILVCRGLISEATLTEALERQHTSPRAQRLGAILIEMGKASPADVEAVMRHQTGRVVSELSQWPSCFFKFEAMAIPDHGEIEVDAKDFLVVEGLSTDHVLFEAALSSLDTPAEAVAGLPEAPTGDAGAAPAAAGGEAGVAAADPLRGIAGGLVSLQLRGEITLMLKRQASQLLGRGVLFAVRGDEISEIGRFGRKGGHAESVPGNLTLSLSLPSIFSDVIQKRETYRGPLEPSPGNDRLVQLLGGRTAREVVAVPMVVGGSVAVILYGDNLPGDEPIGPIHGLETAVTRAGLEMEKETVEARIREFERGSLEP
jgi:Domain of unknown function (DUF4388)